MFFKILCRDCWSLYNCPNPGGYILGFGLIIIQIYYWYVNSTSGINGPEFFIVLIGLGVIASLIDIFKPPANIGLGSGMGLIMISGLIAVILYWDQATQTSIIIGVIVVIYLSIGGLFVQKRMDMLRKCRQIPKLPPPPPDIYRSQFPDDIDELLRRRQW